MCTALIQHGRYHFGFMQNYCCSHRRDVCMHVLSSVSSCNPALHCSKVEPTPFHVKFCKTGDINFPVFWHEKMAEIGTNPLEDKTCVIGAHVLKKILLKTLSFPQDPLFALTCCVVELLFLFVCELLKFPPSHTVISRNCCPHERHQSLVQKGDC